MIPYPDPKWNKHCKQEKADKNHKLDQLLSPVQNNINSEDTPRPEQDHESFEPAVDRSNRRFKGKARADQPRWLLFREQAFNNASPEDFRLQSADAVHDLRRWLISPNSRLDGSQMERNTGFLGNERFTINQLQDAMVFAIQEIRNEHDHIISLVEYGQRSPYNITFRFPIAPEADQRYFEMEPDDLIGAPREGLEEDLLLAAKEIDYLREVSEHSAKEILGRKKAVARFGNTAEIEALLRLGVTMEEWVQKECVVT